MWDIDTTADSGYIMSFSNFPDTDPGSDPDQPHAMWTLVKREGGVNQIIGSGAVNLLGSHGTMIQGGVYRIRVTGYCGNIRVQAERVYESASEIVYDGGCAGHPLTTPDCWDTVLEWSDIVPLDAGQAGLYSASTDDQAAAARFDNVSIEVWPPDCLAGCTNWTLFGEDWAAAIGASSRDELQFKYLYEGLLQDPMIRLDPSGFSRIDCEVGIDGTCAGWLKLVDLPAPNLIITNAQRQLQDEKIKKRLEPVASAVRWEDDGGIFSFVQDYNDKLRDDYDDTKPENPIPVVASGDTPIAAAMMDAYGWYVSSRSGEGAWTEDKVDICRKWYVLLITDGEESCHGDVCGDGGAASLFASPDVPGLPPVQVSTIGFSSSVSETSPLRCLADVTGGTFATAANAQALADQLNAIINQYQTEDSTFASLAVSPQLSTSIGSSDTSYLLSVPVFVPQNGKSIWNGHLYTFLLDAAHRSPPVDADGYLDAASSQWDAGEALENQLHEDASPFRNLYWPSKDGSGSWARVSLADVKTDATRKAEFKALTGDDKITDAVANDVVDFVYFLNTDDRPPGYSALGDIYHSRPVIVGAPRNFKYLLRNLNDYPTFASDYQNRRRVVFAGANDGLFHAFDIGQWVNADEAYGTGTGKELFGIMPQAVMPNLYAMAAQSGDREQQYMVDGQTSSADVHIDIAYAGPPGGSDLASRTWRTIVLATMRAGGRSVLALDVTQPDTASPSGDLQPDCLDVGAGCTQPYPRVMWEFTDRSDLEALCPQADADAGNCDPADYWDLGDTWSKPLIARVRKASNDEMFVAFFGGGNDPEGDDTTGNFIYGVDIETGQIIYKENVGASVPGGVDGLDKNDDGFVDVIYFGTTNGYIYRLDLTQEAVIADAPGAVPPGKRVNNWNLEAMYSFGADIKFYTRPVLVPVRFDANGYQYAIAMGSGDRDHIEDESSVHERFYFVLENDSGTVFNESNLQGVAYDADPATAGANYFNPDGTGGADPTFGWYLALRAGEKVTTDALVVGQVVVFPTFVRTPMDPDNPPTDADGNVVCQASGLGRVYKVNYVNANPIGDSETRGIDTDVGLITGMAISGSAGTDQGTVGTIGGSEPPSTNVDITILGPHAEVGGDTFGIHAGARVTNWRQE